MKEILSIELKPIQGKGLDLAEVYDEIWHWQQKNIKHLAKSKASQQVLTDYLGACRGDGWTDASTYELNFVFSDGGGNSLMSMTAAQHWFSLSLISLRGQLEELLESFGYELGEDSGQVDTSDQERVSHPMVILDGALYVVQKEEEGELARIFTDGFEDALSFQMLSAARKKRILNIAQSGICECPMCKRLRKGKAPIDIQAERAKQPQTSYFERLSKALRYPHLVEDLVIPEQYIGELPEAIGDMRKMVTLSVWGNHLEELPDAICKLEKLILLGVGGNDLTKLPENIGALSALEFLELQGNQLRDLPSSITKLKRLRKLDLGDNPWDGIPAEILELKSIKDLILMNNPHLGAEIADFPFDRLPNLERLWLNASNATCLPSALLKMGGLLALMLRGADIPELPEEISNWTRLESLWLDKTGLRLIPEELCGLTELKQLELGGNQIREVPESIGNLTNLTQLCLASNPIEELPDSIGNLKRLEYLHVYNTDLKRLPKTIEDLPALKTLGISKGPDPEALLRGLQLNCQILDL